MPKKILILNGSPRTKGNTSKLISAFKEGAVQAGHEVIQFDVTRMNINSCLGCLKAKKDPHRPCTQHDDMDLIYQYFPEADVIVFASPIYFWTITGPLKTVADRLYAELESMGYGKFRKESVLLATADGSDYSQARRWYETYERNLGWKNRGEILGKGQVNRAFELGKSL